MAEEEGLPDVDSSFRAQLREYRRQGAPKKMLKALEDLSAERKLNQNMTVYALRTLQRLNRSDLSVELLPAPLMPRNPKRSPAGQPSVRPRTACLALPPRNGGGYTWTRGCR